MKITVCVKMVSEVHFTDSIQNCTERLKSGRLVINPVDEYALELALRMKDQFPEISVTVVMMAPASAENILLRVLAMGADHAVLVCDRKLAGADTLITSDALAAAVRHLPEQDLILCGQKSIDSETGHIGPQLSVRMGYPVITNVIDFRLNEENNLILERVQDEGMILIKSRLPLVLTVCKGTKMIRIPGISGMAAARRKKICYMDAAAIGMSEGMGGKASPTQVVRLEEIRHAHRDGQAAADIEAGVNKIMECLTESGG